MGELKYVTYKNLKKGQEISGAKSCTEHHGFKGYVKEANAAYVIVEKWEKGGREEKYSSDFMFGVEMTDEEFRSKYNSFAGEIIEKIQSKMIYDEIGYHEMANGWLSSDPWEMAKSCKERKYCVIGHSSDITPKTAMFSGEVLDVGVCAEDEDGERFWCHFRSDDIEILVRRYKKYQKLVKEGKQEEYNGAEVAWEYREEQEEKNK